MGQDFSSPFSDAISPERLKQRTVKAVADYIKDGRAKRIVVMARISSLSAANFVHL